MSNKVCLIGSRCTVNCVMSMVTIVNIQSAVDASRLIDEEKDAVTYNLRGSCGSASSK